MKTHLHLLTGFLTMMVLCNGFAQDPAPPSRVELKVRAREGQLEASVGARALRADGTSVFPLFEVQRSTDFKKWTVIGQTLQGGIGGPETLTAQFPIPLTSEFYRLSAHFSGEIAQQTIASGGDEVFGYAPAFKEELAALGLLTTDEFVARYAPPSDYLPQLDWDPTSADFWPEFNVDPAEYNATLLQGVDDLRSYDFRLDENELAVFKKNGFVVSERLGAPSCGEILARLWQDDMPVFIGSDPLLQAWHRSYDMMLSELEETYLFDTVQQMLEGMASKVTEAATQAGEGPLKDSVRDADYMITVARSLLAGTRQPSSLAQDDRVTATLAAISALQLIECFDVFGQPRAVDFSQFKPRGHYTESEQLGRYFRCVKWLGRAELRVAGGPFQDSSCDSPHMAAPRELGTAIVLNQLLNSGGQFQRWQQFDRLIQTFVGWTDSMTFAQLSEVLRAAGIAALTDVQDIATLESIQDKLVAGAIGAKDVRSDWFNSPLNDGQARLPQSFTIFGAKFVVDSWALSKSVYDSIVWDVDGDPATPDKVPRRTPSALDISFSVFGNNQIVPEIISRIRDQDPARDLFRDGWTYQHNLAAARGVIDKHPASAWDQNLYMGWIATLRELSNPVTEPIYPDALRTRAWAMKDVNSQLASWTHMRHDTILYAEAPYTGCGDCGCSYPHGFVEPRPAFWGRFKQMALNAGNLIATTDYRGTITIEIPHGSGNFVQTNLSSLQTRHIECFQRFADAAGTLAEMSQRELRQEPFSEAQYQFLQNTMVAQTVTGYFTTWWEVYGGWYPKLFYHQITQAAGSDPLSGGPTSESAAEGEFQFSAGALKWDALVSDVHTDVPCATCEPYPDPGNVLHEAVGNAHLLMIAINNGPDRRVYAGPVLSHYEFQIPGPPQRLSDPEWKDRWRKAGFGAWAQSPGGDWSGIPTQPEWTRGYLVPLKRATE